MAKGDVFVQRMQQKFNAMKYARVLSFREGYREALRDLLKPCSDPASLRHGRQLNMQDIKDALKALEDQDPHLFG